MSLYDHLFLNLFLKKVLKLKNKKLFLKTSFYKIWSNISLYFGMILSFFKKRKKKDCEACMLLRL